MRKAGYEVRVLATEGGSYEDNPPNLAEFIRRDLRWCQGNMQYWSLLSEPGLKLTSRFQLAWAVMLFVGVPAWTLLIVFMALRPTLASWPADMSGTPALALYVIFFLMSLTPKLAGFADVAMKRDEVRRYGGAAKFALGCAFELVFSLLLSSITTFKTTIFLASLMLGHAIGWGSQSRDALGLSWRGAIAAYWPQTLFGVIALTLLARQSLAMALWSLPLTAGYVLAIPFAVATSSSRLGTWMAAKRLCGIPEEFEPVAEIEMLKQQPGALA